MTNADHLEDPSLRPGVRLGQVMPRRAVIRFGSAVRGKPKWAVDGKRKVDTVKLVAGC
jgi:hypothetical protein